MGIFFSTEEEKRWWTELQNYKFAGGRFVDGVLALGLEGALRGDLGPTESGPSGLHSIIVLWYYLIKIILSNGIDMRRNQQL